MNLAVSKIVVARLAGLFGIDVEHIRKETEWETLTKKAKAARLAEVEARR